MYIRIMTRTKLRQILPQTTKMALVLDDSDIEKNGDGDPLKLGVEKVGVVKLTKILMTLTNKNATTVFSYHKRLSCLSHTLQLVIHKFDAIRSHKQAISAAHRVVYKVGAPMWCENSC